MSVSLSSSPEPQTLDDSVQPTATAQDKERQNYVFKKLALEGVTEDLGIGFDCIIKLLVLQDSMTVCPLFSSDVYLRSSKVLREGPVSNHYSSSSITSADPPARRSSMLRRPTVLKSSLSTPSSTPKQGAITYSSGSEPSSTTSTPSRVKSLGSKNQTSLQSSHNPDAPNERPSSSFSLVSPPTTSTFVNDMTSQNFPEMVQSLSVKNPMKWDIGIFGSDHCFVTSIAGEYSLNLSILAFFDKDQHAAISDIGPRSVYLSRIPRCSINSLKFQVTEALPHRDSEYEWKIATFPALLPNRTVMEENKQSTLISSIILDENISMDVGLQDSIGLSGESVCGGFTAAEELRIEWMPCLRSPIVNWKAEIVQCEHSQEVVIEDIHTVSVKLKSHTEIFFKRSGLLASYLAELVILKPKDAGEIIGNVQLISISGDCITNWWLIQSRSEHPHKTSLTHRNSKFSSLVFNDKNVSLGKEGTSLDELDFEELIFSEPSEAHLYSPASVIAPEGTPLHPSSYQTKLGAQTVNATNGNSSNSLNQLMTEFHASGITTIDSSNLSSFDVVDPITQNENSVLVKEGNVKKSIENGRYQVRGSKENIQELISSEEQRTSLSEMFNEREMIRVLVKFEPRAFKGAGPVGSTKFSINLEADLADVGATQDGLKTRNPIQLPCIWLLDFTKQSGCLQIKSSSSFVRIIEAVSTGLVKTSSSAGNISYRYERNSKIVPRIAVNLFSTADENIGLEAIVKSAQIKLSILHQSIEAPSYQALSYESHGNPSIVYVRTIFEVHDLYQRGDLFTVKLPDTFDRQSLCAFINGRMVQINDINTTQGLTTVSIALASEEDKFLIEMIYSIKYNSIKDEEVELILPTVSLFVASYHVELDTESSWRCSQISGGFTCVDDSPGKLIFEKYSFQPDEGVLKMHLHVEKNIQKENNGLTGTSVKEMISPALAADNEVDYFVKLLPSQPDVDRKTDINEIKLSVPTALSVIENDTGNNKIEDLTSSLPLTATELQQSVVELQQLIGELKRSIVNPSHIIEKDVPTSLKEISPTNRFNIIRQSSMAIILLLFFSLGIATARWGIPGLISPLEDLNNQYPFTLGQWQTSFPKKSTDSGEDEFRDSNIVCMKMVGSENAARSPEHVNTCGKNIFIEIDGNRVAHISDHRNLLHPDTNAKTEGTNAVEYSMQASIQEILKWFNWLRKDIVGWWNETSFLNKTEDIIK